VPVFFLHVGANLALPGGVNIALLVSRQGVAAPLEDFNRFRHGDAGERKAGDDHIVPHHLADLRTVHIRHTLVNVLQPAFHECHHILVRIDPRHFHVHAGELGHVAGGEGRVGAEHGTDLKDPVKTGSHCHLLVELR